jgi:hypothetical protein
MASGMTTLAQLLASTSSRGGDVVGHYIILPEAVAALGNTFVRVCGNVGDVGCSNEPRAPPRVAQLIARCIRGPSDDQRDQCHWQTMQAAAFNSPEHHGEPHVRAVMERAGYEAGQLVVKQAFEKGPSWAKLKRRQFKPPKWETWTISSLRLTGCKVMAEDRYAAIVWTMRIAVDGMISEKL